MPASTRDSLVPEGVTFDAFCVVPLGEATTLLAAPLRRHPENDFQFDRSAEWKLATPYTKRQGLFSFPKTSCRNSEAASATFG
jgi:hypothetical protein